MLAFFVRALTLVTVFPNSAALVVLSALLTCLSVAESCKESMEARTKV